MQDEEIRGWITMGISGYAQEGRRNSLDIEKGKWERKSEMEEGKT